MNDPLEETITNVKSFNSEIETTNNNNSLEEIEIFLIESFISSLLDGKAVHHQRSTVKFQKSIVLMLVKFKE
ncbi:14729_t:CDS:2 [Entrophospora sp. SA101]|nr:14729_t:CDS:2 [Entrophospora sp. SA101]